MRNGDLLAFDTPRALKSRFLHGAVWSLDATPLLETVDILNDLAGISQASMHGDRAQVILSSNEWTPESLSNKLSESGITVNSVEPAEPTLEDVFTLLARQ
jgi:ABC-type multidrug transport system ATPase subunit